jgi:hypothetical protein
VEKAALAGGLIFSITASGNTTLSATGLVVPHIILVQIVSGIEGQSMDNTVAANDTYIDKLKKSIPGEVTAFYLSLKLLVTDKLIGGREPQLDVIMGYLKIMMPVILVMLVIAALYLYAISQVRSVLQVSITVASLFIWAVAIDINYLSQAAVAFALPWPFDPLARHSVVFLVFVTMWSFCIPIIYAIDEQFRAWRQSLLAGSWQALLAKRLLPAIVFIAVVTVLASQALAQQKEVEIRSFWFDARQAMARAQFLDVDNAFSLALVLERGTEGNTQKYRAQTAERLVPLQPGNCRIVEGKAKMGDNIWLMLNNTPIDPADMTEKVLRIHIDHYSSDPGEADNRLLARSQQYEDIRFKLNANIGKDDAVARVVFSSFVRSSVAIRLNVAAINDPAFDERVAGSYLLILDPGILEDGYFPQCRRRRADFLWGWGGLERHKNSLLPLVRR